MADDAKIYSNFTNLPMETLVSAPLIAAADSNLRLAQATYDFINNVWLDEQKKPRVLSFDLQRPADTGGAETVTVNAPFAALVETPNLMVRSVDVQFTMEVKDVSTQTAKLDTKTDLELSAKYLWFSAKLTGSLTTSLSNTRTSDQSAKYDVRVHAGQAEATEGMNRLAQVFASAVEPLKKSTN